MMKLAAGRDVVGPDAHLIRDAAEIAGKSSSWIRTMRACGALDAAEIDGRQGVTAESLSALLADLAKKRAAAAEAKRNPFAGFPRLAFSNPGK